MANVWMHNECIPALRSILESTTDDSVKYAWPRIRDHLEACLFLVSRAAVIIRPLIPPTHTHQPFAESRQRLYLSAMLGGTHDLQRVFGVDHLDTIEAQHAQSGRRFIFVPGAYVRDVEAHRLVSTVFDVVEPRRALLLAPSERAATASCDEIANASRKKTFRLTATDITDSLSVFTSSDDTILTLPGRYDGIDLPHDNCRILLMAGNPATVSELEQHLSANWKLGPILRSRERTRLVQGLGRCTRGDTDYSVVFWLRQSLVDASLSPALLDSLPTEVRAELVWGRFQSENATDPASFVGLVLDLLRDQDARAEASQYIRDEAAGMAPPSLPGSDALTATVKGELLYSRAMWAGYWEGAVIAGQGVVDCLSGPVLAAYRAWWCFLTGIASYYSGAIASTREALVRALACGINQGFLSATLRGMQDTLPADEDPDLADYEGIWSFLTDAGWAGPRFGDDLESMERSIGQDDATEFHMGTEKLGKALGAEAIRSNEQGAPDVVWCFPSGATITFEAKTEKGPASRLSKKELLQANGHVDWVAHNLTVERKAVTAVVVAYSDRVDDAAEAFIKDLRYLHAHQLREMAHIVAGVLGDVRALYRGRDFSEAAKEFGADLRARGLSPTEVRSRLTATRLKA